MVYRVVKHHIGSSRAQSGTASARSATRAAFILRLLHRHEFRPCVPLSYTATLSNSHPVNSLHVLLSRATYRSVSRRGTLP